MAGRFDIGYRVSGECHDMLQIQMPPRTGDGFSPPALSGT
jgi:hypothetical protein